MLKKLKKIVIKEDREDHEEEEIISEKKEERKNDQMRREINFTEYMENDQFVDNLEHLNSPEKKEVLCLIEKYREVFIK